MASIKQAVNVDKAFDAIGYSGKNLFLVVIICVFMPTKPVVIFLHCTRLNQGGFGL
jgi:hypothetical protein